AAAPARRAAADGTPGQVTMYARSAQPRRNEREGLLDGTIVPGKLRRAEPLARHTSMRVGGPADLFCEVESPLELGALVRAARRSLTPVFVLGGGTNLIVSDRGVRGLTVKLGRSFAATTWAFDGETGLATVGAAANFKRLVLDSASRGLSGLEFGEG